MGHVVSCSTSNEKIARLASLAPLVSATQTPRALFVRTSPQKLAGADTPLVARACYRARIDDCVSDAGSERRRACRVAYLAWVMRWRARYSRHRSRRGSSYQLSSVALL